MVTPHAYLIPLLPLLAAGIHLVRGHRGEGASGSGREGGPAGVIAVAGVVGAWLLAALVLAEALMRGPQWAYYRSAGWFNVGSLHFRAGFYVDALSAGALFLITTVAVLALLYSWEYLASAPSGPRFYAPAALATGASCAVVLAADLLGLSVAWGLVAFSACLLAGWGPAPDTAHASGTAAGVLGCGGASLLLGGALLAGSRGTPHLPELLRGLNSAQPAGWIELSSAAVPPPVSGTSAWGAEASGIGLALLLVAALVMCAQFPLSSWLAGAASAGGAPAAALLLGATALPVGAYLVARLHPLLGSVPPLPADLLLLAGGTSAAAGAIFALTQADLLRLVACASISQLGLAIAAFGCTGATSQESFLAGTAQALCAALNAALLALAAGAVIHATGTRDVWRMGGLRGAMPASYRASLIGWLAAAGLPLAAVFWSRDLVLNAAWSHSPSLFWCLLAAAALNAFAAVRALVLVFGDPGAAAAGPVADAETEKPARAPTQVCERGPGITVPVGLTAMLLVLLTLALLPEWGPLPAGWRAALGRFLRPVGAAEAALPSLPWIAAAGLTAGLLGSLAAARIYRGRTFAAWSGLELTPFEQALHGLSRNGLYLERVVRWGVVGPALRLGRAVVLIDRYGIDLGARIAAYAVLGLSLACALADRFLPWGLEAGASRAARAGGTMLRAAHTGRLADYLVFLFAGIVLLHFLLARMSRLLP